MKFGLSAPPALLPMTLFFNTEFWQSRESRSLWLMPALSFDTRGNALYPPGCSLPAVASVAPELFSLALVRSCWFSLAELTSSELGLAVYP